MRSILEKALVALINEDKDQADALFHEFVLERSRQIHESLRQGEDMILDENWEQSLAIDEMFSEADLLEADDEEGDDEEVANSDDVEGEDESEGDDAEGEVEAEEEDTEGEDEAADEPIEDRVSDLEAQLAELTAEFDALMGDEEVVGDEVTVEPEFGGDEVEEGELDITQGDNGDLSITHHADDVSALDDEQFESLGESIVDELEDVSVKHAEGMTTDGKLPVDTKSRALSNKHEDRLAGEPVEIKSSQHNGYEREAAPKNDTMKPRRNTVKKSTDGQSKVSKEGDKSAVLNTGKEDTSALKGLFDKKLAK